ncbi:MAG: putative toxin-antitoxin system toxin component, PIN family [Asticcacaulis sp.]
MIRAVIDTNILIKARRSCQGASNALMRALDRGAFRMLVSVPLFLEYEAVLTHPEHLLASGLSPAQVSAFLDYLAGLAEPVKLHYLWRPQLVDVADEMVLETAVNGRADCVVTFNTRHFVPAERFGIDIIWPDEALRRLA